MPKGGMRELGCYGAYDSSLGLLLLSLELAFVVYICGGPVYGVESGHRKLDWLLWLRLDIIQGTLIRTERHSRKIAGSSGPDTSSVYGEALFLSPPLPHQLHHSRLIHVLRRLPAQKHLFLME